MESSSTHVKAKCNAGEGEGNPRNSSVIQSSPDKTEGSRFSQRAYLKTHTPHTYLYLVESDIEDTPNINLCPSDIQVCPSKNACTLHTHANAHTQTKPKTHWKEKQVQKGPARVKDPGKGLLESRGVYKWVDDSWNSRTTKVET